MNNVRSIENLTEQEFKHGIFGGITGGSWHEKYIGSAWVFVGGLNYELTEGDIICVMSQWGEVEDIHLVREKETNKSKGFAFIKYEDYRSTILAVDNFNGISLLGRTLRCDHVENYKLPKDILEKEAEKLEADPSADVDIGPGHAYKHKDLASEFDINKGVDLWRYGSQSEKLSKPHVAEEREEKKESKKHKKHKHKHKKDKKEKTKQEGHHNFHSDGDSDAYSQNNDDKEFKQTHRGRSEERGSSRNIRKDNKRNRSNSRERMHDNGHDNKLVNETKKHPLVAPSVGVASWRGNRDPELMKQKLARLEGSKTNNTTGDDAKIFSSSNNKVYEERKRDEFGSFGGFNRVR